jgi:hypothetical protein
MINEHDIRDMWPEALEKVQNYQTNWTKEREQDPFGKSAKEPGSKLDAGKSPIVRGLLDYFPRACMEVAKVSAFGANKYAWKGWETVPDGVNRYGDAAARHVVYEAIEGLFDQDSGLLHAAHMSWNSLARLELMLREIANKGLY